MTGPRHPGRICGCLKAPETGEPHIWGIKKLRTHCQEQNYEQFLCLNLLIHLTSANQSYSQLIIDVFDSLFALFLHLCRWKIRVSAITELVRATIAADMNLNETFALYVLMFFKTFIFRWRVTIMLCVEVGSKLRRSNWPRRAWFLQRTTVVPDAIGYALPRPSFRRWKPRCKRCISLKINITHFTKHINFWFLTRYGIGC